MVDLADFLEFEEYKGKKELCFTKVELEIGEEECVCLFPMQEAPFSEFNKMLPKGVEVYIGGRCLAHVKEHFMSTPTQVIKQFKEFYMVESDILFENVMKLMKNGLDADLNTSDDLEWYASEHMHVVENSYAD